MKSSSIVLPLIVLLLVLTSSVQGWAQTDQGRIVDSSGNPIADVQVTVKATCTPTAPPVPMVFDSVTTDAEGRFPYIQPTLGGGSSCQLSSAFRYTFKKSGYIFEPFGAVYRPGNPMLGTPGEDSRRAMIQASLVPAIESVSAASYNSDQIVTREMITAGFGLDLVSTVEIASLPLPTSLANRSVLVKDVDGQERMSKLFFVSPRQINYLMPDSLPEGTALVRLIDENSVTLRAGYVEVRRIAPGIFTANADGAGVPAGIITRVQPGNVQTSEPVARLEPETGRFVPALIDFGPESDIIILSLFGSGFRQITSISEVKVEATYLSNTSLAVTVPCTVEYAGKQPTLEGLDQLNVRLPRELQSKDVALAVTIAGKAANVVRLAFK